MNKVILSKYSFKARLFIGFGVIILFNTCTILFALKKLKNEGCLLFEINEYLGKDMINLLHENKFKEIELKQDIFKKDRMIKGKKISD